MSNQDRCEIIPGKADEAFLFTSTLKMKGVSPSDQGKYFCKYGKGQSVKRSRYGLRVTVEPKVDCKWMEWSKWSQCSQPCGGGWRYRARGILRYDENGGKPCAGVRVQEEDCGMEACPRT